jgi:hypothetical protein
VHRGIIIVAIWPAAFVGHIAIVVGVAHRSAVAVGAVYEVVPVVVCATVTVFDALSRTVWVGAIGVAILVVVLSVSAQLDARAVLGGSAARQQSQG